MRANVIQVYPFNIDKVKLLTMRGAPGARGPKGDPGNFQLDQLVPTNSAAGSIANFADGGNDLPVKDLKVNIQPSQDLHGYSNPWPGGGGKNLLNPTGTTATDNGITFTVNADGTVKANGTASDSASFTYSETEFSSAVTGTYLLNGNPTGAASSTYRMRMRLYSGGAWGSWIYANSTSDVTINMTSVTKVEVRLMVASGQAVSNIVFKPMLRLSSVSDATYAPYSNICPITGWTEAKITRTGKNLYSRELSEYNIPIYATDGTSASYPDVAAFWIKAKPSTKYTVTMQPNTKQYYLRWIECDAQKRFIFRNPSSFGSYTDTARIGTFTTNGNTEFLQIAVNQYQTAQISQNNWEIQIEESPIATAYEPSAAAEVTIPLGSTVYGGTLDVSTGVLTVDRAMVTRTWAQFTSQSSHDSYKEGRITYTVTGGIKNDIRTGSICDKLRYDNNANDSCFYVSSSSSNQGYIRAFVPLSIADTDEFTFVYPIPSPTTVQLTAQQLNTLLGVNNIWSDAGDVSVEYYANTKLYIDLAGQTEDDMTANANIASGRYFQIGNTLYISTAAIAAGETIVPGTNCRKTTIAEALNALL